MRKKMQSKRFFMTVCMTVFLAFIATISVFKSTEFIGSTALTAIMTITTGYVFAQTKRSSFHINDKTQIESDL